MKKFVFCVIVLVMIFSLAGETYADSPVTKLGRGIANVLTSPFELTKGMGDATRENGIFSGLTVGLLQGTVNIIKRAAVGVYEIGTFPIPLPENYAPILDNPEFFLKKDH